MVVFINMNTYIVTEGANFKTFMQKSYPTGLDSSYMFTKNMLNEEWKMLWTLFVIEFAYTRHS